MYCCGRGLWKLWVWFRMIGEDGSYNDNVYDKYIRNNNNSESGQKVLDCCCVLVWENNNIYL